MRRRRQESGFAMLLVFLLAACVAITLYVEIPRVAFEAERQRELLLMDRGNQFKRAIQVFYTDKTNNPMHRYPASIEELESFNNHRYLRRRYVDPMTGKDEWRLVHINGGVLTDSVLTKNGAGGKNAPAATTNDYISVQAGISVQPSLDSDPTQGRGGGAARAMGRRPSDSAPLPGSAGFDPNVPAPGGSPGMQGNAGGLGPTGMPLVPGSAAGLPGQPGAPGQPNQPGQIGQGFMQGAAPPPTVSAQPACNVYIGGCPTSPTATATQLLGGVPGLPPQPGMPVNSQAGGAYATTPGANGNPPGYPQPGVQISPQAQNAAAGMIQNLLTTPRPGGMPTNMPGAAVGGGIVGVASKFEAEGILVINDRTAINEWEYLFDQAKYRQPPNPLGGTPGTLIGQGLTGTPIPQMGPGGGSNNPTTQTNQTPCQYGMTGPGCK